MRKQLVVSLSVLAICAFGCMPSVQADTPTTPASPQFPDDVAKSLNQLTATEQNIILQAVALRVNDPSMAQVRARSGFDTALNNPAKQLTQMGWYTDLIQGYTRSAFFMASSGAIAGALVVTTGTTPSTPPPVEKVMQQQEAVAMDPPANTPAAITQDIQQQADPAAKALKDFTPAEQERILLAVKAQGPANISQTHTLEDVKQQSAYNSFLSGAEQHTESEWISLLGKNYVSSAKTINPSVTTPPTVPELTPTTVTTQQSQTGSSSECQDSSSSSSKKNNRGGKGKRRNRD